MQRNEIENKIDGLKLRLAKEKKRISTYETSERGKYNKLWQEKIVPLQKEIENLGELWGKSKYAKGGGIKSENAEMVLNNNKQISHHTKELATAVKGKKVPAWVVAKVNRSASDLSDATHYLDGSKYGKGGTMKGFCYTIGGL